MSNPEFSTPAARPSSRRPTCTKEHFLRRPPTMSTEGNQGPSSPTPSTASTASTSDMMSLLQMLTAQNARMEQLRMQQDEAQRQQLLQMEQLRLQQEEKHEQLRVQQRADQTEKDLKSEERRMQHELAMAQLQSSLVQAQTTSAREVAELQTSLVQAQTTSAREVADKAEALRRQEIEAAEQHRLHEADLRLQHLRDIEEKQAVAAQAKAESDAKAKVEASIRHIKRDTPKMLSKDFPPTYMASFERIAHDQGVPESEWASCFLFCLSGGEYTIWATLLDSAPDVSYRALKPLFLSRVGHDWSTNASYVAFKKKPFGLSFEQYMHETVLRVRQLVQGVESVYEAVDLFVKAGFTNFLYGMKRSELCAKKDLPLHEFGKFLGDCDHPTPFLPHRSDSSNFERLFNQGRQHHFEPRHEPSPHSNVPNNFRDQFTGGKDLKDIKTEPQTRRPFSNSVICHNCGEPGHIRPHCPKKTPPKAVNRAVTDSDPESGSFVIGGMVNGVKRDICLDTGAQMCVVPSRWVPDSVASGPFFSLHGVCGSQSRVRTIPIDICVLGRNFQCSAAVVDDFSANHVLLGTSIGKEVLLDLLNESVSPKQVRVQVTRMQSRKRREEEAECEALDALDGAVPCAVEQCVDTHPAPVSSIVVVPESDLCSSADDEDDLVATPAVGAESGEEVSLPVLELHEREELIASFVKDDSLASVKAHADAGEKGYSWDGGMLMHEHDVPNLGTVSRIVVPLRFRPLVLNLAHKHSGHLGIAKVRALLAPLYTWPGIHRDVRAHCLSCTACQTAKRGVPSAAPYQCMPILTEPFEKLATDIVGPFPRSSQGYKYLLTTICLASKYPDVVPLKDMSAVSVAEALVEIFSRTGLPRVLLSDQGSQFVSSLMKQLCVRLGIARITTSTYHPQSNGCLERLHGTLTPMIRKAIVDKLSWPEQVKYALFALRGMPARDTGYSPYEIVYGRKFPSPLSLLFDYWSDHTTPPVKLSDWLERFEKRVEAVRDSVREKLEVVQLHNQDMQQKKLLHTFSVGDSVLLRACGLPDKLAHAWEGPYIVKRKIGIANYELNTGGRGRRSRAAVVHVNNIKAWHDNVVTINRVILAQDDDCIDGSPTLKLVPRQLSASQTDSLSALQLKFKDCLVPTPGLAEVTPFPIDTGDHPPLAKAPYRIPERWRPQLRTHTEELQLLGVIRLSRSPWCSSSVTVGKRDGSLRLCQDYRPLNQITVSDPYQMKRIDDTLDLLGEASFLTKLDLSKGYYQIPMVEVDIPKTAFSTPFGKFEYTRMPFGLKNAPSHFQRTMDIVLADLFECSSAYIDDVIIFSRSFDDHLCDLTNVLTALAGKGFTIKPSKCVWAARSVEYLGFEVGEGKLSVPEARIQSISAITLPQTVKQLRSFIGTLGYYRRFVPSFASMSSILTPATVMGMPKLISWTPEMHSAFNHLRVSLSKVLCLSIPTSCDVFTLVTDASSLGIGSVLCITRDSVELPVAFHSRQLRARERTYSASELEGLAVVEAIRHFEVYLFGASFTVVTDHKALTHLFSSTVLNAKLWRWALYLQQFSISFRYLPGRFNVVADCLSRQTWPATPPVDELPDALSTEQVIALKDTSMDHLPHVRLSDRPLPFESGGDVGALSPVPDTPTLARHNLADSNP